MSEFPGPRIFDEMSYCTMHIGKNVYDNLILFCIDYAIRLLCGRQIIAPARYVNQQIEKTFLNVVF